MLVEFYKGDDARYPFASARSDVAIRKDDLISIAGVTYLVTFTNFALDTDIEARGLINQRVQVTDV